tara:strand:+ start:90 stop:383 length:294 start_codon:yes stop_codon:yes gene_type:complete
MAYRISLNGLPHIIKCVNARLEYHTEPGHEIAPIPTPLTKENCKVIFEELERRMSDESISQDGELDIDEQEEDLNDLLATWSEVEIINGEKRVINPV